jgi:hypothetical protein
MVLRARDLLTTDDDVYTAYSASTHENRSSMCAYPNVFLPCLAAGSSRHSLTILRVPLSSIPVEVYLLIDVAGT